MSNLEECIDITIDFASELQSKWRLADYRTKQRIQFLLFPEGIRYSKKMDRCRTTRVNSLFAYVAHLQQVLVHKKRGILDVAPKYASFAYWVAWARSLSNYFVEDLKKLAANC